jgi:hypothetical protein
MSPFTISFFLFLPSQRKTGMANPLLSAGSTETVFKLRLIARQAGSRCFVYRQKKQSNLGARAKTAAKT